MKDKLMNALLAFAGKISSQRHMIAIKNAFTANLPIIITGSFATLILNVVLSTTTTGISLAKVPGMAWLANLAPMFNAINYATMNFFTIGLVVLIALELGKQYGHDEFVLPVVALSSYVSLTATWTTVMSNGELITIANVLPRQFTNAQGIFLGMIVAIVSTEIYVRIVDSGKLDLKMPDSVPPNIAKSFSVLFPSVLTIMIIAGFGMGFEMLTGMTLFDAIAAWIQAPLKGILTGLPGYLFLIWMTTLLWSVGIHGTQVLKPVYEATMLEALAENMDAVLNGLPAPNILNNSFLAVFSTGTGAGITGGLIAAILIFSTRKDFKAIAKLSIPVGLFNINEPMTFGLPIVLNPLLVIPFMIAPAASATFGYFMTKIGIAIPMAYTVPWTTPPLLKSFLSTGGHMGTVFVELGAIIIAFLVYLPFVMIANKQEVVIED